jgi:hypothetical protein
MIKILSIIALALGGNLAIHNWYSIYASRKSNRFVTTIPFFGGALLFAGLMGFTQTRPYALLGFILDYGTLIIIYSIPTFIKETWHTSSFNLKHMFTSEDGGRKDDIRLFKNSNFTIRCIHKPLVQCDEHGALIQGYGFEGKWLELEGTFRLEGYSGERVLEIRKEETGFITIEQNYPQDKKFNYDKLGGRKLQVIK